MALEIVLLIGIPFALGVLTAQRWPALAARMRRPVEIGTLVIILVLATSALAGRAADLAPHLGAVALGVLLQNALSFLLGYGVGKALRMPERGLRAMTLELGMRNTGLALVLVMAFFEGIGGAVLLVAAWAVWDVIVGLVVSDVWRRRSIEDAPAVPEPAPSPGPDQ